MFSKEEERAGHLFPVLWTAWVELHGFLEQLQGEGDIAFLPSYQPKHVDGILTGLISFAQQLPNQHLECTQACRLHVLDYVVRLV